MSPFFRGSVRPAKKHPRAWSMNPRLNPDLDKGAIPRMSILGLPSTETDVILPVFNSINGRKSLDDTKAPVAISVSRNYVLSSMDEVDEPAAAPAQAVPRTAETSAVAEPSKGEAPAAETPQLTTTSHMAPAVATAAAPAQEEGTRSPIEESPKEAAPSAPAEPEPEAPTAPDTLADQGTAAGEDGAPPTPAVAAALEDVFTTPMEEMPAPATESAGAGAEANLELPAPEPLPAEPALPAIEEEEPAAAAAAEDEVPAVGAGMEAGASTASGLEPIEEKPVDEAEVATPAAPTAGAPSEPEPSSAEEEASAPVVEEAPAAVVAEAPTDKAPKPEAEDPPSEAAGLPQRLLAVPTADGDDVPAAATSGSRSSLAGSASAAPSVATANNEEPLITDEQLEVSDEFKPGMTLVPVDPSH